MATANQAGARRGRWKLETPGWNERTRRTLEKLIEQGTGKQLPVVLDFDNTIICGDIGEATLAVLVREGKISAARLPKTLSPAFYQHGRGQISLNTCANPAEYYEAFLAPTVHGDRDPTPLANGYAWAVEAMEGLYLSDVLEATRKACEFAQPGGPGFIKVAPGKSRFPVPRFYPEMVELVAALLHNRFDVWIVSASNVWSVRWMVQEQLNPRLREHGVKQLLRADHVIGVSTLLTNRRGGLCKDALLTLEDPGYAALDPEALGAFRLTSRLQFPVPTYSGKIACIYDAIGLQPYLAAGDSPGDHAMLASSQNRLWIARLEKPGFQEKTIALIGRTGMRGWMIQPTLTAVNPGFLPEVQEICRRLENVPKSIGDAVSLVRKIDRRVNTR